LPFVGIRLSPFWAAAVSLSAVASAYMAETFRAGIEAVPWGQFEAAQALGFSWPRMMIDITLPQAIRLVVPPATGICVGLIKDTALASVVAMPDLLKQATQAQAFYANPSPLVGAAILYLVLLLPLVRLVGLLEKRRNRRR
jgi:polar amino acid transport system permease protein